MIAFTRRIYIGDRYCRGMYTVGNVGMVMGMVAGGWLATPFPMESVPLAAMLLFLGMTAGMILGMFAGMEALFFSGILATDGTRIKHG